MEIDFLKEKGILQLLTEKIGFDSAKLYWDILLNKENKEFSHNKKYRLLQELYKKGILFKLKENASFHYIPIPISAILFNKSLDQKILESLDEKYKKNFFNTLLNGKVLIETSDANLDGLILFFIRNLMKEKASIIFGGPVVYDLLRKRLKNFSKIKFIGIDSYFKGKEENNLSLKLIKKELVGERRIILIDNTFLMSFFKVADDFYFGYLTNDAKQINERQEEFDFLWKFR